MAKFAFGTQRISEFNPQHIQALKEAISSGIDIIDTSSEYLEGSAHRAIAIVFRELDEKLIQDVKIVSKFTYKEDGDIVKKLHNTLNELNVDKIDCFMVFNLEYYLLDAINKGISRDNRLDGMNKIIYKIFFELENEIKNKKINSYGISSENFSLNHSLEQFLPYEDLVSIAQMAANDAKNDKHSFSTIEFPLNLLERDGLKCAKWAKQMGLRVLTARPLNALHEFKQYRLAQYEPSSEYYYYLNELLEVCNNDLLKPLYNLVEELDISKHKFGWIEDYDNFIFKQGLPHIKAVLNNMDDEHKNTMINYITMFLQEYRKMVALECFNKTKNTLQEYFGESKLSMQKSALSYLKEQDDIDYILVGMRKPSYVAEVLAVV